MNLKELSQNLKAKEENGIQNISITDTSSILEIITQIHSTGARLAVMFGEIQKDKNLIHYLFDQGETLCHIQQEVNKANEMNEVNDSKYSKYISIYNIYFNALFFEQEIMDMFGWVADGNEKLSRLVHHSNVPLDTHPLLKDFNWDTKLEWADIPREFLKVEGKGVFEIPVGPIHAGVIEPGHFKFSLAGERIINIQPMLWYQHKGTEKLFETIASSKYIELSERISGDTSVSHTLAHCQAIEKIMKIEVPKKAQLLRVIVSELERMYNHVNDIGFIGQDTGFGPAGAQGMRLKEIVIRQNDKFTGSRMLRNILCYGGVRFNPKKDQIDEMTKFIESFEKDYKGVIAMNEDISTMTTRMETCGVLKHSVAKDYGTVGIPARGAGVSTDVRFYHPYDAYKDILTHISLQKHGDVESRYLVRVNEVYESIRIIKEALNLIPHTGDLISPKIKVDILKANGSAYGLTEGWRGEVIHYISIKNGKITRCKIKDPSFSNWQAMVPTINGNIIGDFPLINKSFNLSYSGNDL